MKLSKMPQDEQCDKIRAGRQQAKYGSLNVGQYTAMDETTELSSIKYMSDNKTTPEQNGHVGHKTTNISGVDNVAFSMENDTAEEGKGDDYKEESDIPDGCWATFVNNIQMTLHNFFKANNSIIWNSFYGILAALYFAYFGYAMHYKFSVDDEGSMRLLVVTVLATLFITGRIIYKYFLKDASIDCCESIDPKRREAISKWMNLVLGICVAIFAIVYVIVDIGIKTPRNLISAAGIAALVLLFYIFSANPAKVKWRPVFWGLALQFIFALIILRWDFGYEAFQWLGDRVSEFLTYSDKGAIFVFGEKYTDHFFAFKVLPVIVFFSTCVSILYYLGVMQFIIRHLARFLAAALGTSPTESLNAAGNIFLGQTEAPLMIRPFFERLTNSEIHAVCTGGFATIAGSVMAAYILYGVPANHLLSASVMSAPAALAMAKLFYPETEKVNFTSKEVYNLEKGSERNIIEAAMVGATQSIKLVANVAVNLIAFVALLEFVNATLRWFGHRVGLEEPEYEELTFQFICSYVFWPLAFLMGVETVDCRKVAELVGVKTFINEFVAYTALGQYIDNAKNLTWYEGLANQTINNGTEVYTGTWHYANGNIVYNDLNITLPGGVLQDRSVVISTYALCGFANISSIGIQLGAFGAMAPSRKSDLSKVIVRAMIAGNVACFTTACIAGLLYEGEL